MTVRMLPDLLWVFPEAVLCSRIIAENGAGLYRPDTRSQKLLGTPPPESLVESLKKKGVPLAVGASILATMKPHEVAVLETIRDLGMEHHIVFNREAVMVLPPGVDKGTGLKAALLELQLSPHNVVGIERIGWRTLKGAVVEHAGSVVFQARGNDTTHVIVTLQYDPPGGTLGAALASLFGQDPAKTLEEDLARFKDVMEKEGNVAH